MDERHDPKQLPRRLTAVTDLIAETEGGNDDWLAAEEPTPESGDSPEGTDGKVDGRRRPGRARKHRLVPVGAGIAIVVVAAIVAAWQLRGTPAIADPSQAAGAARRAGSFAFVTRSELLAAGRPAVVSTTAGQVVDLHGAGAFKVRVTASTGVGFERLVFPDAVYFRAVGARGARSWIGAHLRPPVTISTEVGSGGGLGDPLGLLAALRRSHAQYVGIEYVDQQLTRHYTLTLPLSTLTPPNTVLSPSVRSIPVRIEVWQAPDQRLVRAVRAFEIGGPRHLQLEVRTDFRAYGEVAPIKPPAGVEPTGYRPLDPTADDPVGASLLGLLAAGIGHSATPSAGAAPVRGTFGAPAAGAGPKP
jgi:hypothetical protein